MRAVGSSRRGVYRQSQSGGHGGDCKDVPLGKLVLEHTMYPQHARFIPLEQKKAALHRLGHDNLMYIACSVRSLGLRGNNTCGCARCVSKRIGKHTVKPAGIGSIKSET